MVAEKNQVEVALAIPVAGATPGPGIYRGVPSETYHRWNYASSHRLSLLARSPAHMRHSLENPAQSDAMAFGEAVHTAVLQPELFETTYVVAPKCDRRTTVGKAAWTEFCKSSGGKKVIEADDRERAMNIASAVMAHPAASDLLFCRSDTELSVVWDDAETGVRCKMRADFLCDDASLILDLKTTQDASRDEFVRAIKSFGYARQGAFYLHGMAQAGRPFEGFCCIAAESKPLHAVAVYRIPDEAITKGWDRCRELLLRYAECEESGEWPAYSDEIQDIEMPSWAIDNPEISR